MIRRSAWVFVIVIAVLGIGVPASAVPTAARTITPGHSRAPRGGTTTTGQGLRPDNGNAQLAENIPSRVRRSWAVSPRSGICPYNGSEDLEFAAKTTATNGKYTVVLHNGRCDIVTAYRTKNGKPVWSAAYPTAFALVSDGKYVYVHWEAVVDDDMVQFISALKISSGKVRWTRKSGADEAELSVGSGVVAHGTNVFAAKTGRLRFFTRPVTGSDSRTLVVKGMLIRNSNDVVDAWTPKGKQLWRFTKSADPETPGGGSQLPQYNAGRIYIRDDVTNVSHTLVLDAKTGRKLPDLPRVTQPLAFDGRVGIFTSDAVADGTTTVSAIDLKDGFVYWTRSYNGISAYSQLRTPPIIEHGLVWFGLASSGQQPLRLVALDEATGATRARISEKCRLDGHDPRNHEAAGTIGVAQHRLFVPSACGLQTYVTRK